jgi:dihydrofolate reductase
MRSAGCGGHNADRQPLRTPKEKTMRTLKLAIYVALDGVVENPAWTTPFWKDELAALQAGYLFSSDALVLGRVTYEGFAAAWPSMEESTGDFGRKMNSMPKHVATRTLHELEWNAAPIEGDLAAEVRRLKEQDGADLLIYGSGMLVDELTRLGLIDEYRLILFPTLVASGKKLFEHATETAFRLVDSTTTETGVAVLTYLRAGPAS